MTAIATRAPIGTLAVSIPSAVRRHAVLILWTGIAVGARIAFWAATDRTWEDALITVSNARNALGDVGMTHHPGEGLVHSFTSALSVLVPLAGELLREGSGLAALRIASLIAAVATMGYGYAIARRLGIGGWPLGFVMAYLALNQNHILYGMAGMETQVAVAVLLAGVFHVLHGHHARAGFAAGVAVLARPDLVLWLAIVVAWAASGGWRTLSRAAAAAAMPLTPWLVFTTLYYGSPMPHSIPAKAAIWSPLPVLEGPPSAIVGQLGDRAIVSLVNIVRAFTPFYEDTFVIDAPVPLVVLLAIGALIVALMISGGRYSWNVATWRPAVAYVVLFTAYRAALLPLGYFDWYLPPFTAVCALLAGLGLQRLSRLSASVSRAIALVLVAGVAISLPFSFGLEATIQRDVEYGIRRTVGLYLREVIEPGEAFIAESAGYFGYYSKATIWDQPGLTSPTAYAATRSLPPANRRVEGLVDRLRPEWAVLRPPEWARLASDFPGAAACYTPMRSFGYPDRDRVAWDGLLKVSFDWSFTVYRRVSTCPRAG